ncbi:hypothetical protein CsSME_00044362 [Camellia sinensis var. sinensis]|uniref:Protein kinase domain-containing protein n=2 Tax=Camellia sinensis TaxID=4442 RepID=A0A7J7GDI3_CAMSI|nr:hypothetical protein HYC85_023082 [Camellia sinensis]
MMWRRGKILGKGGSAMVYVAAVVLPTRSNDLLPSLMAVKSAPFYKSRCLAKEERLLSDFADCPHIIRCFGEDLTIEEDGEQWYNILLEYAAGGSLADRIQSFGRGLPESEVRRFTKSLLMGLSYIHKKGYVHCDIKPHNILLVEENDDFSMSLNGKEKRVQESTAKIADFGLAKRAGKKLKEKENKPRLRGTALYMAPESILREEYEPHVDIWAVGCTVLQMLTGKEPWKRNKGTEVATILFRIGFSEKVPEIPSGLSKEAEDFLNKCLVRDPKSRWTADMLLGHPFVSAANESIEEEKNRVVVLPKAAKPVPDSSFQSSFSLPKPYLLMSRLASDGLVSHSCVATRHSDGIDSEDFDEFHACKRQKRMEEDAEQVLSGTSYRLDALGQYWGIKRISEITNSNIAIEIFN